MCIYDLKTIEKHVFSSTFSKIQYRRKITILYIYCLDRKLYEIICIQLSKGRKIFPLVSTTVIFKMKFAKQLIPNVRRCIWVFHLLEHISCLKFHWKTIKSKLVYKSLEKEMTFWSALLKETKLVNASDF